MSSIGPAVKRENSEVLAGHMLTVEQIPQFRALVLRVPLTKIVAVAEETFLRSCLLLVPSRPANAGVVLARFDGFEQGGGLQSVAACLAPVSSCTSCIDGGLDAADRVERVEAPGQSSRNSMVSGKLWPVSMCTSGMGIFAGAKALAARCVAMLSFP